MKKSIETALRSVLTSEQVAALKEEIFNGIRKVNGVVDSNQKIKAKKDFIVSILAKTDSLIESSDKSPVFLRALYSAAKNGITDFIRPILEEMIDQDDINDLDDIPDVEEKEKPKPKPKPKPKLKSEKKVEQKAEQKKPAPKKTATKPSAKKPVKTPENKKSPGSASRKGPNAGRTKKAE